MNVQIRSKQLKQLGVRRGPSIKQIGNGFIIKCPSKDDTYRNDPKKALTLFKARQKQFIKNTKKQSKKKIADYKQNIKEEEQKLSNIDKAFDEATKEANNKFSEQISNENKKS